MKGFELMANRSDRRGEHADSSLGHSMAVTTIGAPRANIHHGPEPEHSSTNPDYARDLNPSEIWVQKKSRSSLI